MKLYNADALEILKTIPDKSVDLVLTDPPYDIKNTKPGGSSKLSKSMVGYNNEIKNNGLTKDFNREILNELVRVSKKINMYLWCNKSQIISYLDFFVKTHNCSFDILCWHKTNAMPTFSNKYLTDKEYCLYFRKGGKCQPDNYENAKTVWNLPINVKDKKLYKHPTIKPLSIIETLVSNSSSENEVILDCFMGSGTTGVACKNLKRDFIGIELNKEYFDIAKNRIENS